MSLRFFPPLSLHCFLYPFLFPLFIVTCSSLFPFLCYTFLTFFFSTLPSRLPFLLLDTPWNIIPCSLFPTLTFLATLPLPPPPFSSFLLSYHSRLPFLQPYLFPRVSFFSFLSVPPPAIGPLFLLSLLYSSSSIP